MGTVRRIGTRPRRRAGSGVPPSLYRTPVKPPSCPRHSIPKAKEREVLDARPIKVEGPMEAGVT